MRKTASKHCSLAVWIRLSSRVLGKTAINKNYLYSKKTHKEYALRHHCMNRKEVVSRLVWQSTMETNKRATSCWCHTYKHAATGCWFHPIAHWTDYCHYGPQYEMTSSIRDINIKFIHSPVHCECSTSKSSSRIEHHRAESSFGPWQSRNWSRNSPLIMQHGGQYRVYKTPPPFTVVSQMNPVHNFSSQFLKNTF